MQLTESAIRRPRFTDATCTLTLQPKARGYIVSESSAPSRPVIRVAIGPRANDDRERFQEALREIAQRDSFVRIKLERDGQTIISGMSEFHLEGICDRISREYKIQIDVGKPEVIYLEGIRKHSEAEGKYIRQTGGLGNYGHVKILLEPNETGNGFEFINGIRDIEFPKHYIQPIEQGIRNALQGGVLAGCEVVDVKATLFDGSHHDVESNEMSFRIAGSIACKNALRNARPVLLEPVMAVEVAVPEDHLGMIIGGLNSCRARIEGMEQHAGLQVVKASVPLSEMLGYAKHLRASTNGKGDLSIRYARYEEAPPRGGLGGDEPGVAAIKPSHPRGSSGSAAANLDEGFE
jgi:elongation factor G